MVVQEVAGGFGESPMLNDSKRQETPEDTFECIFTYFDQDTSTTGGTDDQWKDLVSTVSSYRNSHYCTESWSAITADLQQVTQRLPMDPCTDEAEAEAIQMLKCFSNTTQTHS